MVAGSQTTGDKLSALESRIQDLADQVDTYKAKTAASLGGGVFLILLAACGAYDLFAGNAAVWLAVGITHTAVYVLSLGFAVAGGALLLAGLWRNRTRNRAAEFQLAALEEELYQLQSREGA